MKKIILISVILAFSLTCFAQKGKWKKAQKVNTIESYQKFLIKNPDSEFYEEAKTKLIELEFQKAQKINTVESYQNFLIKNPDSEFYKEARSKLIELEFQKAIKAYNISALKIFIKNYPQNEFESKVNNLIRELSKIESTILEYKIGESTYENFLSDKEKGSWKSKVIGMNQKLEQNQFGERKVVERSFIVIVELPSNKKFKLTFSGESNLKLTSRQYN
jgi:hypothetical protein